MKKLSICMLISASLMVLAFTFPETQKKYDIKYKSSSSRSVKMKVKDEFRRTTIFNNGDRTGNTINDEYDLLLKVNNGSLSDLSVEIQLFRLQRTNNNPGGTSTDEFMDMTAKTVNVDLDSKGNVKGLKGFTDLPEKESIGRRTAPDHWMQRIYTMLPVFPDESVGAGDTWTYEITGKWPVSYFNADSDVKTVYNCVIKGVTKKNGIECLEIESSYTMTSLLETEYRGRHIKAESKAKGIEKIFFSVEMGLMIAKEGVMNTESEFSQGNRTDYTKYSVETEFDK